MNREHFKYLLRRYKADLLSDAEQEDWFQLAEDEDCRSWVESDIDLFMTYAATDPSWSPAIAGNMWEEILKQNQTNKPVLRLSGWVLPSAAAALFVIACAWCFTYRGGSKPSGADSGYQAVSAPPGMTRQLSFSDGTRIWLNASSTLRFPSSFDGPQRLVSLEGQAYFEVSPRPHSPFFVKINGLEVEVLGTRFIVEAYPNEPESRTSLLEGAIRVNDNSVAVLLQPGRQAIHLSGKKGFRLATFDPAQVLAWKENRFSFNATPLEQVAHQLERWYNVTVECAGKTDTIHITGYIPRNRSLEEVVKMLGYTHGIRATRETGRLILHGPS